MADHFDALDFDLFDRWRVRLRDVPLSIGWGAVALFIRHLPYDSEVTREMDGRSSWSGETHMIANLTDLIGDLFAKDYEHIRRPGAHKPYESAAPVEARELNDLLALFGGGSDG